MYNIYICRYIYIYVYIYPPSDSLPRTLLYSPTQGSDRFFQVLDLR